jgi:putative transcriptional regulator
MKNRIKVARAEWNLSQGELAEKIGVSRQTINSILALKIARTFENMIEDIFQLEDSD